MRCHAAGLGGFFLAGFGGTKLSEGKETGRSMAGLHVFEKAAEGDIALLKANKADRWGNLTYISRRGIQPCDGDGRE